MRMEGIPQYEVEKTGRPSRIELEERAEAIWKDQEMKAGGNDESMGEWIDQVAADLRRTAEEPDRKKNPDSVAKYYPGYEQEDFEDLAHLLETKKS